MATHRLTAEKFRFQTKTGCYSCTYSIAYVIPRGKILGKCNMIYSTCMKTEMKQGFMTLCCFGTSFPSLNGETCGGGENNALTKEDDIVIPPLQTRTVLSVSLQAEIVLKKTKQTKPNQTKEFEKTAKEWSAYYG